MMPCPFHFHFASGAPHDNYYGCDPYNTVDAPELRGQVRQVESSLVETRPAMRPIDAWAQIGHLMFGGKRT